MGQRHKVVLVDDDITNLTLGKNVLSDLYDVVTLPSGEKLLNAVDSLAPDLILLDVSMPEMDGYEVLRRLKQKESTLDIPVVFLTAKSDTDSELTGLSLGAVDYINKPFEPTLLRKRIKNHLQFHEQQLVLKQYNEDLQSMVAEKTKTVLELKNAVLNVVAELVECRDEVTGDHIFRTQEFLKAMLICMIKKGVYSQQVSEWDTTFFVTSSQLHDVGKIMIKDSILQKPGKLTAAEFEEMKKHTTYGARIIDTIAQNTTEKTFLQYAHTFAISHHERWDGTGYPYGLKGEDIPLEGRLMAIGDVYDALISKRPYKQAMPHKKACAIIIEGSGSHFDPTLVEVFALVQDEFAFIAEHSAQQLTLADALHNEQDSFSERHGYRASQRLSQEYVTP